MTITTIYPLFHEFVAFIEARERLRLRRAAKQWPWTTDPILSQYRFCNVNRQHDRMTIRLQEWLFQDPKFPGRRFRDFVEFNAVPCRLFNQRHTMDAIGWLNPLSDSWQAQIRNGVLTVRNAGLTPFNPAYIVSTNGVAMDKVEYLIERVIGDVAQRWRLGHPRNLGPACKAWADWYMQSDGLGRFIANQIVTDLKYGPLSSADDTESFVMAGPGTKRGLNRLLGKDKDASLPDPEKHLWNIRQLLKGAFLKYCSIKFFNDLNNLSNCFCEFDKYQRAKTGEGRPKQHYEAVEEV